MKNRLSSFLWTEAGVNTNWIKPIKTTVFLIQTNAGSKYILKGKKTKEIIDQQWAFFEQYQDRKVIQYSRFPNNKKVIEGFGYYWTWTPYMKGEALNYDSSVDREDAFNSLQHFHDCAKGIKVDDPLLLKPPLYMKGITRLSKLDKTKSIFEKNGFSELYSDLNSLIQNQLEIFTNLDWYQIEKNAVDNNSWIHGDVAAHNFIRTDEQEIYLIDLDLLTLAPPIYDYIQLGQRFLPFLNWDINQLLKYAHTDNEESLKTWLLGISVPTDLVREWWLFLKRQSSNEEINRYLKQFSYEVSKRIQFVDELERMMG
ncbi:phosphotransferase [Aquibacillus kalidii]|uniref:phosphotransferase n=1 Tax=Aquibacillus kalidii TaxID=2762597 RepID=UPI0016485D4C|nr:phosphotransferase [Aquibacillus kalidii]